MVAGAAVLAGAVVVAAVATWARHWSATSAPITSLPGAPAHPLPEVVHAAEHVDAKDASLRAPLLRP